MTEPIPTAEQIEEALAAFTRALQPMLDVAQQFIEAAGAMVRAVADGWAKVDVAGRRRAEAELGAEAVRALDRLAFGGPR